MAQNRALLTKRTAAKSRGLDQLIALFVRSYLSPNTKTAYAKDIELFLIYCRQQDWQFRHPQEIQSRHLQQYRDHLLSDRKQANNTVNRKMVALRGLMQWCVHEGIIDRNPLLNVRLPKAKVVSSTLDFSDEEVKATLALPNASTASGSLHQLVLTLLFYLGLRKGEIIGIRWNDCFEERNHHVLRILGKGDKHRDIPLTPQVRRVIDQYRKTAGKNFAADDYLLQPVRNNYSKEIHKPLHPSSIDWIVKRYADRAGIKKRVSPHSCRATVVGNLLENRIPIRDVANLVGHASIQTTSQYDKRKANLDRSVAYSVRY
jgi:site-specific recombinase XerD